MKVGIILAALAVAMGNAYADGKEEAAQLKIYQDLEKTPKPYDDEHGSIAWEKYGQDFYNLAIKINDLKLKKECYQRSAEYFAQAGNSSLRKIGTLHKEIEAERIKIVEFLKNAPDYFKKASHSFAMADDPVKSKAMDDKATEAENKLKAALIPKAEEHLATFVTPAAGGKLQQTK